MNRWMISDFWNYWISKLPVSRCIAMPTDSQACACSLSRHSPYASSLECACLCAGTRQSPSAHLRMAHCCAQTSSLAKRLKATEDLKFTARLDYDYFDSWSITYRLNSIDICTYDGYILRIDCVQRQRKVWRLRLTQSVHWMPWQ